MERNERGEVIYRKGDVIKDGLDQLWVVVKTDVWMHALVKELFGPKENYVFLSYLPVVAHMEGYGEL